MDKKVLFASLLTGLLLVSCGNKGVDPKPDPKPNPDEETVKPDVPSDVKPTGVTIEGKKAVAVGKDITLTAKVAPDNATDKSVTWSSADDTIATVDATGKVTGVAAGTVKITATSVESTVKAEYEVTVGVAPTGVKISVNWKEPTEISITENNSIKLHVNYEPKEGIYKGGTFTSANTEYVTVDAEGNLVALKPTPAEGVEVKFVSDIDESVTASILVKVVGLESKPVVDFSESHFSSGYAKNEEALLAKVDNKIVKIYKDSCQFGKAKPEGYTNSAVLEGTIKNNSDAYLEFDLGEDKASKFNFDMGIWSTADVKNSKYVSAIKVQQFVDGAWADVAEIDIATLSATELKAQTFDVNSSKVRVFIPKDTTIGGGSKTACRILVDNVSFK